MEDDAFEPNLTVGQRLRQAREARALTLEDVAALTRIPIRHLRSIEDSQWDDLPALTYTVGFGRSYANAVGLDGTAVGRELRDQLGGAPAKTQMSQEYYSPPDPARVPSRPVAWIAALLGVLLVVGYLLWRSTLDDGDTAVVAPPAAEEPAAASQPAAPPAPADLTGQQVTLTASEQVWLRITDRATGNRQVAQRTLQPGEQYQVPLDIRQPLIRTNRPQTLRVAIGGQEIGRLGAQEGRIADVSLLAADVAPLARSNGGAGPTGGTQPGGMQPASPGTRPNP